MCYNATYLTKRKIKKATRQGAGPDELTELERQLDELTRINAPLERVSGFAHPNIPVVKWANGNALTLMRWGLVPTWVRTVEQAREIENRTLNARVETLFDKPAFRDAAQHGRCIVLADSFQEFQHQGKVKVPFDIALKSNEVMPIAAVSSTFTNPETGETTETVSLITTTANSLMATIHNRPGTNGPRMPMILSWPDALRWVRPDTSINLAQLAAQLAIPFPETELTARPLLPVQTDLFA